MNQRIGHYITTRISGESVKAYVPSALPPTPPLSMDMLMPLLEKATHALTQLDGKIDAIPNASLFLYMHVRKEALLSSQIEGTQSSFSDLMLFENAQKTTVSLEDVEEVSNYVKAIEYGLNRLQKGFPLSLRLLREVHGVLLAGSRGQNQFPGEFRRTQNWIGGTRPGNALFVPPPVDQLPQCLGDLEKFLHNSAFPTLIKAGLAHLQFETIHPFLDGNGRLGRLLIILMLCDQGLLRKPVLYMSLYLKQNRDRYYSLLQEVRQHGTWETWLEFFLEGIVFSAMQALKTIEDIQSTFKKDEEKIHSLGRARLSCLEVFDSLQMLPQASVSSISQSTGLSIPTAGMVLKNLTALNILEEKTGKKRDRIYVYTEYLKLLEEGAEPF